MRRNTWVEINDGKSYEGEFGFVTSQVDTHRFRVYVASVDAHVRTFTRRELRRLTPGERRRYITATQREGAAALFDEACSQDDAEAAQLPHAFEFGGVAGGVAAFAA